MLDEDWRCLSIYRREDITKQGAKGDKKSRHHKESTRAVNMNLEHARDIKNLVDWSLEVVTTSKRRIWKSSEHLNEIFKCSFHRVLLTGNNQQLLILSGFVVSPLKKKRISQRIQCSLKSFLLLFLHFLSPLFQISSFRASIHFHYLFSKSTTPTVVRITTKSAKFFSFFFIRFSFIWFDFRISHSNQNDLMNQKTSTANITWHL